jgi:hypothetical protein
MGGIIYAIQRRQVIISKLFKPSVPIVFGALYQIELTQMAQTPNLMNHSLPTLSILFFPWKFYWD